MVARGVQCACLCVCVCKRERQRERKRAVKERESVCGISNIFSSRLTEKCISDS